MVRIDNPDRVFDVSRPGRSEPGATSRPLIVGHRPQTVDPMVREDNPYADFDSEKKVTAVPVTWDASEEESHPPAANDFGGGESLQSAAPHEHDEADTGPSVATLERPTNVQPPATDTLFAPDSRADTSSWSGDGNPPVTTLPLSHSAGAGPKRSAKRILAWLATLLVLAGFGGYLAVDAGIVGANIKLPFEIFKEKVVTPVTTTPTATKPIETQPTGENIVGTCTPEGNNIPELKVTLTCPTGWKIINDSSGSLSSAKVSPLYRIRSADFKLSENSDQYLFTGTEITVYQIDNSTYSKQRKATLDGLNSLKDVKDETVANSAAFRNTLTSGSIEVTVDRVGGPMHFTYTSRKDLNTNMQDPTNIEEFNKLLQSVIFETL